MHYQKIEDLLNESRIRSPLTTPPSTIEEVLERSRIYGLGGPLDTITRINLNPVERQSLPLGYF